MASLNVSKNKDYSNQEIVSQKTFNGIVGGLVTYSLVVDAIITYFGSTFLSGINPIIFLIAYFVCAILGIIIMKASKNPFISFIGYNMLAVPIGCVIAIVIPQCPPKTVIMAALITGSVTLIMMIISMAIPDFFLKMGRALFVSLLVSLIGEIICFFIWGNLQIWDWIVAVIFSLYIGYDWAKINKTMDKTLNSAIDGAADIYLDVTNLFLRILDIINN